MVAKIVSWSKVMSKSISFQYPFWPHLFGPKETLPILVIFRNFVKTWEFSHQTRLPKITADLISIDFWNHASGFVNKRFQGWTWPCQKDTQKHQLKKYLWTFAHPNDSHQFTSNSPTARARFKTLIVSWSIGMLISLASYTPKYIYIHI